MISVTAKKTFTNIVAFIIVTSLLMGVIVLFARMLGIYSLSQVLSQFITVRVSLMALAGIVVINFLFIINALYAANLQNKKQRQIDLAKSEFISLVSHQLRTPLSAVNWYTEALTTGDRGPLNKEQEEYLNLVRDSNHRMIALVNSILEVSRIELDTFTTDVQPTNLTVLVEQVTAEVKHNIEAKKINFKKEMSGALDAVLVDPRYISMVIDNLLSNAIKYSPEGGSVTLTVANTDNKLRITVADTGYGIPKEDIPKVFTKLFRAHNILAKDTDGTGLGLYIVKSVVAYAGGTITFESEENKGTTFFVTIPLGRKTK